MMMNMKGTISNAWCAEVERRLNENNLDPMIIEYYSNKGKEILSELEKAHGKSSVSPSMIQKVTNVIEAVECEVAQQKEVLSQKEAQIKTLHEKIASTMDKIKICNTLVASQILIKKLKTPSMSEDQKRIMFDKFPPEIKQGLSYEIPIVSNKPPIVKTDSTLGADNAKIDATLRTAATRKADSLHVMDVVPEVEIVSSNRNPKSILEELESSDEETPIADDPQEPQSQLLAPHDIVESKSVGKTTLPDLAPEKPYQTSEFDTQSIGAVSKKLPMEPVQVPGSYSTSVQGMEGHQEFLRDEQPAATTNSECSRKPLQRQLSRGRIVESSDESKSIQAPDSSSINLDITSFQVESPFEARKRKSLNPSTYLWERDWRQPLIDQLDQELRKTPPKRLKNSAPVDFPCVRSVVGPVMYLCCHNLKSVGSPNELISIILESGWSCLKSILAPADHMRFIFALQYYLSLLSGLDEFSTIQWTLGTDVLCVGIDAYKRTYSTNSTKANASYAQKVENHQSHQNMPMFENRVSVPDIGLQPMPAVVQSPALKTTPTNKRIPAVTAPPTAMSLAPATTSPASATSFAPAPTSASSLAPAPTSATSLAPVPTSAVSLAPVPTSAASLAPAPTSVTLPGPAPIQIPPLGSISSSTSKITPKMQGTSPVAKTQVSRDGQSSTKIARPTNTAKTVSPKRQDGLLKRRRQAHQDLVNSLDSLNEAPATRSRSRSPSSQHSKRSRESNTKRDSKKKEPWEKQEQKTTVKSLPEKSAHKEEPVKYSGVPSEFHVAAVPRVMKRNKLVGKKILDIRTMMRQQSTDISGSLNPATSKPSAPSSPTNFPISAPPVVIESDSGPEA